MVVQVVLKAPLFAPVVEALDQGAHSAVLTAYDDDAHGWFPSGIGRYSGAVDIDLVRPRRDPHRDSAGSPGDRLRNRTIDAHRR